MITGERLAAEDAYRLGLLAQSPVGAGEALQAAEDLAQRVTAASPSAVRMILELTDPEHDGKLAHETALAALAATTADGREGIAAFRDKRAPVFASVAGDGSAA
jgi:enoyl-CoA hydratase/carnithine racemase